jgi:hypothetical protein
MASVFRVLTANVRSDLADRCYYETRTSKGCLPKGNVESFNGPDKMLDALIRP